MTQQRHEQSRVAARPFDGASTRNARTEDRTPGRGERPASGGKRLASAAERAAGRARRASRRAHRGAGAPSRPEQPKQRQAAFERWAQEAEVEASNPKPARQIGPQTRWTARPQGQDAAPQRSPGSGEGPHAGFLQGMRLVAFGRGQGGSTGRPPGLRSARAASAGGDRAPGACQVLRALRDGDACGVPRRGVGAGAVRPAHCRGGGLPPARPLPAGGSALAGDGRAVRRAGDGRDAGDHEREGGGAAAGCGLAHTGAGGGHGAGEAHGRDRVPDRRADAVASCDLHAVAGGVPGQRQAWRPALGRLRHRRARSLEALLRDGGGGAQPVQRPSPAGVAGAGGDRRGSLGSADAEAPAPGQSRRPHRAGQGYRRSGEACGADRAPIRRHHRRCAGLPREPAAVLAWQEEEAPEATDRSQSGLEAARSQDRRAPVPDRPRGRVHEQRGLFQIWNKRRYPRSRIIPESPRDPPIRAPSSASCRNNHKLFRNAKTLSWGSYLLIGVPAGVVLAIARSFSSRSACR